MLMQSKSRYLDTATNMYEHVDPLFPQKRKLQTFAEKQNPVVSQREIQLVRSQLLFSSTSPKQQPKEDNYDDQTNYYNQTNVNRESNSNKPKHNNQDKIPIDIFFEQIPNQDKTSIRPMTSKELLNQIQFVNVNRSTKKPQSQILNLKTDSGTQMINFNEKGTEISTQFYQKQAQTTENGEKENQIEFETNPEQIQILEQNLNECIERKSQKPVKPKRKQKYEEPETIEAKMNKKQKIEFLDVEETQFVPEIKATTRKTQREEIIVSKRNPIEKEEPEFLYTIKQERTPRQENVDELETEVDTETVQQQVVMMKTRVVIQSPTLKPKQEDYNDEINYPEVQSSQLTKVVIRPRKSNKKAEPEPENNNIKQTTKQTTKQPEEEPAAEIVQEPVEEAKNATPLKAGAKPGLKGPAAKPGPKPEVKAPVKPGLKTAIKTGAKAEEPKEEAPEAVPEEPKAEAKPGLKAPNKPSLKTPIKPGPKTEEAPATEEIKPVLKPGLKIPPKPGSEEKPAVKPGLKAPPKMVRK
ncbi:Hypothetical_protein [Hexamita inflata]|uniref:Hypothetical_protein n=1 Tax=Hexamita inflata TaxID=28002 RepID=A0AA86QTU2_9EUKA|nr:Hypothetical protein HINF_LOCUS48292 [Hexamita inflata]